MQDCPTPLPGRRVALSHRRRSPLPGRRVALSIGDATHRGHADVDPSGGERQHIALAVLLLAGKHQIRPQGRDR